ncbi:hypothetical protein BJ741DRAFT_589561 [Chytriomyces cf. hyalinus JEL632]|nr:hypothetical protein BJ741DRAFT_589561 [Chytriomyces cf. hyalinus JEL632]
MTNSQVSTDHPQAQPAQNTTLEPTSTHTSDATETATTVIEIQPGSDAATEEPDHPPPPASPSPTQMNPAQQRLTPEVALLEEAVPRYTNGNALRVTRTLHSIDLIPSNSPNYFNIIRPESLADRISNLTYTTRIYDLNAELTSANSVRKFQILVLAAHALFLSTVVTILYFSLQTSFKLDNMLRAFLWLVPIGVMLSIPTKPRYARQVQEAVDKWEKENASTGVSITYRISSDRTYNWRLLYSVTILMDASIVVTPSSGVAEEESLPTYSPPQA